MKKYELLEREENSLCRIQALRDIPRYGVKTGDIGGYVECEHNLSHEGLCWIGRDARVWGNAQICGDARVGGYAQVCGNALVCDNALVGGYAQVEGNAWVGENALVGNNIYISKNAKIKSSSDILYVCGIGSRFGGTTFYRTKTGISVTCGCFSDTLDEFKAQVTETHGDNKFAREYELACQLAELHILGKEG